MSQNENGTVLREFTNVADDRQTIEISSGIFYNVWTFNGTVPGPTLRATEGLAIVAPLAKEKPKISYLVALGIIGGAPAIAGTWIGRFVASPVASIVFLAIGAGAVFPVVVTMRFIGRSSGGRFLTGPTAAGLAAGMLIMYLITLLI